MEHGGDIYRRRVELDFSVNINPLGMPESVRRALCAAVEKSVCYPDIRAGKLRRAAADWCGVAEEELVFGNGASELFLAVVHAVRPKKILIPVPSFYGYEHAAAAGCETEFYPMRPEEGFRLTERILERINETVSLLFLANPNNPTGALVEPELMERIAAKCLACGVTLVVDECFLELTGKEDTYSLKKKRAEYSNVILIRAFTKLFAMPGVRLGYAVCGEKTAVRLRAQLPEWNLSVFAQEAGMAALEERMYVEHAVACIVEQRRYLEGVLRENGCTVYPSDACYLLFTSRLPLYELFLERGILIRDCGNFRGLRQGFYRIAVKSPEENRRFAAAFSELAKKESDTGAARLEYVLPKDIERRSFEIIKTELSRRGIVLPPEQEAVTMRVIHTSADFSYADTMTYTGNAVAEAKRLLLQGAHIVTDTNMALSGIHKKTLESFGGKAHCFMADEELAAEAKRRGTTRAAVCMERAAALKGPVIFAVGNAPTALVKLCEMMEEGVYRPAFVIGVPVGFVNVEAAKEMILRTGVPCIVNRGRKGGSNVAAAVCNALLYELRDRG